MAVKDSFVEEVLLITRATRDITFPKWGSATSIDHKSDNGCDIVTEADMETEVFLREHFQSLGPSITFVGEEFGGDRSHRRLWLVDPIDGTGLFARGLPGCTTMVALVEDGRVILGIIYDFVNDVMYYAVDGEGAFANEKPIHVSKRDPRGAYIGYESHLDKEENWVQYCRALEFGLAPMMNLRAGYDYALIASGKMDGRICFDPYGYDYDYAAGSLIVKEAGGVVANIGVHEYDYRNTNFIAATPQLYAFLTGGSGSLFPLYP